MSRHITPHLPKSGTGHRPDPQLQAGPDFSRRDSHEAEPICYDRRRVANTRDRLPLCEAPQFTLCGIHRTAERTENFLQAISLQLLKTGCVEGGKRRQILLHLRNCRGNGLSHVLWKGVEVWNQLVRTSWIDAQVRSNNVEQEHVDRRITAKLPSSFQSGYLSGDTTVDEQAYGARATLVVSLSRSVGRYAYVKRDQYCKRRSNCRRPGRTFFRPENRPTESLYQDNSRADDGECGDPSRGSTQPLSSHSVSPGSGAILP